MAHSSPGSCHIDQGCLETEAQIFIEANAQIRVALRLREALERTHFRSVVGAAADLDGGALAQLAIARVTEAHRCEDRLQHSRVAASRGLATIRTRHAGSRRE